MLGSRQKVHRALKYIAWIVAGYVLAFYIYMVFFLTVCHATQINCMYPGAVAVIRFTLIGMTVGGMVAVTDVLFLSRMLREMNFLLTIVSATLVNVLLSVAGLLLFVVIEDLLVLQYWPGSFSFESRLRIFFSGEFILLLAYLPVVSTVVTFIGLLIQRIGEKNFWNAVKGTYHVPHEEERVFMFLDLYGSTGIAERIGHRKYHDMLHDVFNDISGPVSTYQGEVYQYVGDSVVITWSIEQGTRQMNCLRCYFDIASSLSAAASYYRKEYDVTPHFKAGLHAGKVTAGEVGVEKREVVFHGDTVNTAARIEDECSELGEDLLLSEDLLFRFPVKLLKLFTISYKGSIRLKGRQALISLYSIRGEAASQWVNA
ncbi:MAG: adenylate/guanylate cyclase domain-containing protein [Prosthecochloris sp.]|nr:adenylate/guanylate cyclase domain-containing protein [Prosthecochloris sp.]